MASPVGGRGAPSPGGNGAGVMRRDLLALAAFGMVAGTPEFAAAAGPQGQLTWGVHTTLAPTWFDPAETPGIITPWMVLYALHDALVKPMPGNPLTPSLAESFSPAEDALTYDFVLRPGVKFHNGEPVTAEDVKFSFERYRGSSAKMIKDGVAAVEIPDARHIRFQLKEPWPDFLTYYASATGAGWIVPKKYVEKVGDDGYKKAPIGAGPYKFASFSPGVELVFEAFESYWRKIPSVKRLVFKVIPEETTRLAALKMGEVDIVYAINGELAKELRNMPGLTLKPVYPPGPFWLFFPGQGAGGRRGMTSASVGPPTLRSTATPSTRRSLSGFPSSPTASSRICSNTPGRPRRRFSMRRWRKSSWPRPATPTASTPAIITAIRLGQTSARQWSTISGRRASAPSCARLNERLFSRCTATRGLRISSRARAAPSAMPRPVSPPSSSRAVPIPMAATRRSTTCFSSWCTTRRSTRPYGSWHL